ncbi:hypothetical protein CPSG_08342 [Coccidioides posadasii str. Silveira]|uniref:Uncharacterized protein n=1 Tax=Coccidioides posadasii (strain RMSCC 757 / Silveira) TaxID=443226 RepID=E9DEU2_COCPS|nr:hypothetical protein CPSG_08342 [Coccidioides posadasii str. Silveira]
MVVVAETCCWHVLFSWERYWLVWKIETGCLPWGMGKLSGRAIRKIENERNAGVDASCSTTSS